VPFDDKSPFVTSGIRVGVPAITTRGMKEDAMETVVAMVDTVLMDPDDEKTISATRQEVKNIMKNFPLYPELG
jgi:glycine hydroxymethyltransferase